MELEFEISNQQLTRKDNNNIVNKSLKYVTCSFTFKTSEWQGVDKYVIFKPEHGENYYIKLGSACTNNCKIPGDTLKGDFFKMTLFGADGEDPRITTNELTISLIRSGFTEDFFEYDEDTDTFKITTSVNIITDWSDTPSDSDVPSEKLVKDTLDAVNLLIGESISYING